MEPTLPPAIDRRSFLSLFGKGTEASPEPQSSVIEHEDGAYESKLYQGRIGSYLEWPRFSLTDHHGRQRDLQRDVIAGQPVVLNFFYTKCKGSCPVTMGRMIELAEHVADARRTTRFISVSLEPEVDTPSVLADYAKVVLPAGADWHLLNAKADTLNELRRYLGFYDLNPAVDADPRRHAAMVLIGDERTHRWITLPAISTLRQWRSALARCAA